MKKKKENETPTGPHETKLGRTVSVSQPTHFWVTRRGLNVTRRKLAAIRCNERQLGQLVSDGEPKKMAAPGKKKRKK